MYIHMLLKKNNAVSELYLVSHVFRKHVTCVNVFLLNLASLGQPEPLYEQTTQSIVL